MPLKIKHQFNDYYQYLFILMIELFGRNIFKSIGGGGNIAQFFKNHITNIQHFFTKKLWMSVFFI
jgi:hypothetical protein